MKRLIFICLLSLPVINLFAQAESDCTGALSICSNVHTVAAGQYTSTGSDNDESNATCWSGSGAGGAVWYTFSPSSAGELGFELTPVGSTDYDFALFDVTNGCANMDLLSCNYSADNAPTGMTPTQSVVDDSRDSFWYDYCNSWDDDDADDECGPWNGTVTVDPTKVYALMINFYGGSDNGFTLDFGFMPGLVDIDDNTPPGLASTSTPNCVDNTVTVNFDELIDCSTIQTSDFTLTGPGGPYTVTSVDLSSCSGGSTATVVITTSPTMATAGNYNLNVVNVVDFCGNNLDPPGDDITITIGGITAAVTGNLAICTGGSTTLTASPSDPNYSYSWNTGQTTESISVTSGGTYTATITTVCGFSDNASVTVVESVCLAGFCNDGSGNLVAQGGVAGFTWAQDPGGFGNTWYNIGTGTPLDMSTAASSGGSPFDPSIKIRITDGNGDQIVYADLAAVPACPAVLPVDLLSFEATCVADNVQIDWVTDTETNSKYFVVEKAENSQVYYEIARVDGAGFSKRKKSYQIIDSELSSKTVYYRLAQVDFDGSKTYKKIVSLKSCTDKKASVTSYYNKELNNIVIKYNINESVDAKFRLYDIQGRLLVDENLYFDRNEHVIKISPSDVLSQGVYVIQLTGNGESYTKKLFVR